MAFRTLLVAGGLLSMIAASPAYAAFASFPFVGAASECGAVLCLGETKPFSGRFTVDPSVPDEVTPDPDLFPTDGVYVDAGDIGLTFHGKSYDGRATYSVFDDSTVLGAEIGRSQADGFFIDGALSDADGNGLDFFGTLVGSDLDLFDDDALPTEVDELADASLAFAGVTIQTFPKSLQGGLGDTFEGEMNVVPLPGSVVLFASGLAGLAALRRRAQA